jgi:hypothetical protein
MVDSLSFFVFQGYNHDFTVQIKIKDKNNLG